MSIKKIWENMSGGWRHFSSGSNKMSKEKTDYIVNNVNEFIFSNLKQEEITSTLDWGCGGGILSKELSKFSNVNILDLTQSSLENAKKYLGEGGYENSFEIPNDISNYEFEGNDIDLIFCHAVIQHFPSLEYFQRIIEIWNKINPKYIAIQVKLSNETKEAVNYEKEFLNGLLFNEDNLFTYFDSIGYKTTHKNYTNTLNGKMKLGYYIFEK
jgi:2-polyprenyl-3-methyl-5-hydroxy-6-metoxy-1,4-benzoquinol methylase